MTSKQSGPTATTVRLDIRPASPALGAEICGLDLSRPFDAGTAAAVRAAWAEYSVLLFRDQRMSDDDLLAFSRTFGNLMPPHPNRYSNKPFLPDYPDLMVISNVIENGTPIGNLGAGEAAWHADMTYKDLPPAGIVLYALEVPASGGDTSFASMAKAYDTLPEDLKRAVEGRVAIHDNSLNSAGELRKEYQPVTDPRQTPGARHPLVSIHPVTGRKCLLLGRRRNGYILGMDLEESERLLDRLWAHATQPSLVWTQRWRVGDLVIWDNRATMHRRDPFDADARRIMHRAQIAGDAVIAA
ncbi:MAG: TauD/TfdA dioxygenase family protein [Alphaproteobacteria bacterium]